MQPIYETFLSEAVATGRIQAQGFFTNPMRRKAWSECDWLGDRMQLIDPKKELEASRMKIELGLSTRQRESAEIMGTDFEDNFEQLKHEFDLLNQLKEEREIVV